MNQDTKDVLPQEITSIIEQLDVTQEQKKYITKLCALTHNLGYAIGNRVGVQECREIINGTNQ